MANPAVTRQIREQVARLIVGDDLSQCAEAYIAGDWSMCSCKGTSRPAQRFERLGRELAEMLESARDVGYSACAADVIAYERSANYGRTSRRLCRDVARGYHWGAAEKEKTNAKTDG